MTFAEIRRIYNQSKSQIEFDLITLNSEWSEIELICRLTELKRTFSVHEFAESLNSIEENNTLLPERNIVF